MATRTRNPPSEKGHGGFDMSLSDDLVAQIKYEARCEAMDQAASLVKSLAEVVGVQKTPQMEEALNYLRSGEYKPNFLKTWRPPTRFLVELTNNAIEQSNNAKKGGRTEGLNQAYKLFKTLAIASGVQEVPEVRNALDYLAAGEYEASFEKQWRVPTSKKVTSYVMDQAYHVIAVLAQAMELRNTPEVTEALGYFGKAEYSPKFGMWKAPNVKALNFKVPTSPLRKLNPQMPATATIRYSLTPAGDSQGEFIRIYLERGRDTNLIYAKSVDLKGLILAYQKLSDVLDELPRQIRKIGEMRYDRPCTVERVDWPERHPK